MPKVNSLKPAGNLTATSDCRIGTDGVRLQTAWPHCEHKTCEAICGNAKKRRKNKTKKVWKEAFTMYLLCSMWDGFFEAFCPRSSVPSFEKRIQQIWIQCCKRSQNFEVVVSPIPLLQRPLFSQALIHALSVNLQGLTLHCWLTNYALEMTMAKLPRARSHQVGQSKQKIRQGQITTFRIFHMHWWPWQSREPNTSEQSSKRYYVERQHKAYPLSLSLLFTKFLAPFWSTRSGRRPVDLYPTKKCNHVQANQKILASWALKEETVSESWWVHQARILTKYGSTHASPIAIEAPFPKHP